MSQVREMTEKEGIVFSENAVQDANKAFIQSRQREKPCISSSLEKIASMKVLQNKREEPFSHTQEAREIDAILSSLQKTRGVVACFDVDRGEKAVYSKHPFKIGLLFSGGPAAGGNNVITGIFDALEECFPDMGATLIGFLGGAQGLIENRSMLLDKTTIENLRNMGGFDVIGSGRAKVTDEDMVKVIATIQHHELDGLVIIGGDDSNTNAAFIADILQRKDLPCTVVGVPKTIDGDLQSQDIPISFGFDTATKVYSYLIGNIARDCLSTKKYFYFIRLMGRSASHITLECALKTQPNMALISEEVAQEGKTLKDVVQVVSDVVRGRLERGMPYGLILIPEGLIESLQDVQKLLQELNILLSQKNPLHGELEVLETPQERLSYVLDHLSDEARKTLAFFPISIELQLLEDRDPHGNVKVSQIETERLIERLVAENICKQSPNLFSKYASQTIFYGYEGRSTYPSRFDCAYCYNLGRLAFSCVAHRLNGYMAALSDLHLHPRNWKPFALPLIDLLRFELRGGKKKAVIQKSLVDLQGPLYNLFKTQRDSWRYSDLFQFPPPIQFGDSSEVVETPCLSVLMKQEKIT